MDAFFASVEQQDNPRLKGKPIAVGGSKKRGVVAAASYEARRFGVRSAMPSVTAARKCPQLIFVKPRFDRYKQVSNQVRAIFYEYTDLVEPLSLDEAYLDVTINNKNINSAIQIAQEIRAKILAETGLTASAGISINKFVAKIASDINKPNGMKVILPEEVVPFLEKLPIEKFFGIGKVTAAKMHKLGISNGFDLKQRELPDLVRHFGKPGKFFFNMVRGVDNRHVNPSQERKSISVEDTFLEDVVDLEPMLSKLKNLSVVLAGRIARSSSFGHTLTIKIKYANFQIANRSKTIRSTIEAEEDIYKLSAELLTKNVEASRGVRLLGIGISNFGHDKGAGKQLSLFT